MRAKSSTGSWDQIRMMWFPFVSPRGTGFTVNPSSWPLGQNSSLFLTPFQKGKEL
jgi:hypothetical protein